MVGGSGPRWVGRLFYFNRKGKVRKGMGARELVSLVVRNLQAFVF